MKCVSAYDFNDRLIEGKIYTNKKGESFIINELGESLSTKDIKTYRLYEEIENNEVQDLVKKDLNDLNIDDNKKLKDLTDTDLEKTADEREKELQNQGVEIKDGEYKNSFIADVNAAKAMDGVENGTTSDSVALAEVMPESENPYDKVSKELDKYIETVTIFDESKVLSHLCKTFNMKEDTVKGTTLSDSVKNIAKMLK
jgi:hypothetical protein